MKFDVEGAKKAGYTDEEIKDFMSKSSQQPKEESKAPAFDVEGAKAAGYSDDEIKEFLSKNEKAPYGQASYVTKHPNEAVAGTLITNVVKALEEWGTIPPPKQKMLSSLFEEKAGLNKLSPEMQEERVIFDTITGLLGPGGVSRLLKELELLGGIKNAKFNPANFRPPSAPGAPPSPPSAPPTAPKDAIQRMYEERAALDQGGFGPELQALIDKNKPSTRARELAETVTPEGRVSPYEIAEKALEEVKPPGFEPKLLGKQISPIVPPPKPEIAQPEKPSSLINRVTPKTAGEFPWKTPALPEQSVKSLEGRVTTKEKEAVNKISPEPFVTDRQAGVVLRNEAQKIKEPIKEKFSFIFNDLNAKTGHLQGPTPELGKFLDDFIAEHKGSYIEENATAGEKKLMSVANELQRNIQPSGPGNGFQAKISALMKSKKTLGEIADFEMAESNFKSAYKELYRKVDEAIEDILRNKDPKSHALFKRVNKQYSGYKNVFENDNVKGLFEPKNVDFVGIYKGLLSPDKIAAAERVFTHTPEGRKALNQLKREYFLQQVSSGKKLSKKEISNLKDVLGDKFHSVIDKYFAEGKDIIFPENAIVVSAKKLGGRVTGGAKTREFPLGPLGTSENKLAKIAEKLAAHTERTPESIIKSLDTRSGIKKLRSEFNKDTVDNLIRQKARSILHEGEISHNFTGSDIAKVLNKESNYELFREMFGAEETDAFVEVAQKIGKDAMKYENIKNLSIGVAKIAGATKFLKELNIILKAIPK